jgi:hypothetical protein
MDVKQFCAQRGISLPDLEKLLKGTPPRDVHRKIDLDSPHVRFTVVSDLHIGHKCYRPDVLRHAIEMSRNFRSQFWLIPGDILEGMSGRDGHVYELNQIGASNQLEYAVRELSQIHTPTFAITASNSHDGWYNSKGNMGLDVGPELERRVPDFEFMGLDEATLNLKGVQIRMTHPGDGVAYALSYKGQRYLNSLSGGQKPAIVFQGHYHKAMYMFYRNVHFFDAGTLCDQTNFMKKKGTPAMVGYWLVDVVPDKKGGVDRITPQFVPFYD